MPLPPSQPLPKARSSRPRTALAVLLLPLLCALSISLPAAAQIAQHAQHKQVRAEVSDKRAAFVDYLGTDQQLALAIVLPLRNQAALDSLLKGLYDPSSPTYRKFLSVSEFTNQFGPTADDYNAVVAFAKDNGLTVTADPANRRVVPVQGTVANLNRALM